MTKTYDLNFNAEYMDRDKTINLLTKILAYIVEQAGGEIAYGTAELDKVTGHVWLDYNARAGVINLVSIPDYVLSGIEAARLDAQHEKEEKMAQMQQTAKDFARQKTAHDLKELQRQAAPSSYSSASYDPATSKIKVEIKDKTLEQFQREILEKFGR